MRGLLLLSDPHYGQINPGRWLGEESRLNLKIQWDETAASSEPPLLSACQLQLSRLQRHCDWVCVMAEGRCTAHALILASQLHVDRLILLGGGVFQSRHPDRRQRRINAFARRNLPLVTAGIIAVGMDGRALRRLHYALGFHSGGMLALADAAELWRKRESFLTEPFSALVQG